MSSCGGNSKHQHKDSMGSPLHDPVAIAYAIDPTIFETTHMRVDVDYTSSICLGQTVCDIRSKSTETKNCYVTHKVDVNAFWDMMFTAWAKAAHASPL